MKKVLSVCMALALMLVVVPAMASDDASSFVALSKVETTVAQVSDDQLAAVEGAANICAVCLNVAAVVQANTAIQAQVLGANQTLYQSNNAWVFQKLRQ